MKHFKFYSIKTVLMAAVMILGAQLAHAGAMDLTAAQINRLNSMKLSNPNGAIYEGRRMTDPTGAPIRNLPGTFKGYIAPRLSTDRPVSFTMTVNFGKNLWGTLTSKVVLSGRGHDWRDLKMGAVQMLWKHREAYKPESSFIMAVSNVSYIQLLWDNGLNCWIGNLYVRRTNGNYRLQGQTRLVRI